MSKKIFSLAMGLVMLLPFTTLAQTSSVQEIQQRVAALQQQVKSLQGQSSPAQTVINSLPPVATKEKSVLVKNEEGDEGPTPVITFDRDLYFGLRNDSDVSNFQEFLTDQGLYTGSISGNFFILTRSAVKKFQAAHGLKPTGYVGPATRAIANEILTGSETPPSPPPDSLKGSLFIEPSSATLKIGESVAIKAYYQPPMPPCPAGLGCIQVMPAAQEVNAHFVSDSPDVATVVQSSKDCSPPRACPVSVNQTYVSGVSAGTAIITASYNNYREAWTAQMKVHVAVSPSSQGYLSISPDSATLKIGENQGIKAIFDPPRPACLDAVPSCKIAQRAPYEVDASFTSDNSNIAEINVTISDCASPPPGTQSRCSSLPIYSVRGVSAGVAVVSATYRSGGDVYTAKMKVAVVASVPQPLVTILVPNGGETWTKGTTQTIKWQDNRLIPLCPNGAQCMPSEPKYYDIKLVAFYPPCKTNCPAYMIAPYTIAKSIYGSSYNWSVGKIVDISGIGGIAPDGSYTIEICQTGSSTCDSSDSYFKIIGGISTNNPPIINSIPAIPSNINPGKVISFDWAADDPDGDNLSWSISWGDDSGVAGACASSNSQSKYDWRYNASHAWKNAGKYVVKATVSDCRGGGDEQTFTIVVSDSIK